ncbi:hypothetical protein D9M69_689060 [compost metagenome]
MGSATTVATGVFSQERVRASHQAMGVPTSARITVVSVATWNVSQSACRSDAVRGMGGRPSNQMP